MKNFTAISCLSLMLATFAVAEESNIELRLSAAFLKALEEKSHSQLETVYFEERHNCICFRNRNAEHAETCIPVTILRKFVEQYKNHAEIFPKTQRTPTDVAHEQDEEEFNYSSAGKD
ncbi:hypothetical protein A3J41_01460 [candidate division TM6 bacterium RIFCSPHIGHO2_12_FULL_38_8]|nr:MAG: hypothetical protein A3J41_01460 [candidate division TM6 bacterium RIFCSPHIGHO2_12_FULL_38_8]